MSIPIVSAFRCVEDLEKSKWKHAIGNLTNQVFEAFVIRDHVCDEFDSLILSIKDSNTNQYAEILNYFDSCFEGVEYFLSSQIILLREKDRLDAEHIISVESSFLLSLRKHAWIPARDGKCYQPSDVYFLPRSNVFSHYFPCLDESKVKLKNERLIDFLTLKREIKPNKMFELFMQWSCKINGDSLWNLIAEHNNNSNDMCVMISI